MCKFQVLFECAYYKNYDIQPPVFSYTSHCFTLTQLLQHQQISFYYNLLELHSTLSEKRFLSQFFPFLTPHSLKGYTLLSMTIFGGVQKSMPSNPLFVFGTAPNSYHILLSIFNFNFYHFPLSLSLFYLATCIIHCKSILVEINNNKNTNKVIIAIIIIVSVIIISTNVTFSFVFSFYLPIYLFALILLI